MTRDPSAPIVCGVYFLFRDGALDYVGQSKDCHGRIADHRANGREFDFATVMPLRAEFLSEVENALIKAYAPRKNIQQKPAPDRLSWGGFAPVERPERQPVKPSAMGTVGRVKAREMAAYHGIRTALIDEAEADGRLRFVASRKTGKSGKPVMVALHSEVEAFCLAEKAKELAEMGLA